MMCVCVCMCAKQITAFSNLLSLVKISRSLPCPWWNLLHFECSLKLQCTAWNILLLTMHWGASSTVDYCLGDIAWQLHCTSPLPSSQLINPPFSSLTVNTVCFPSSVSQVFSPPHPPTAHHCLSPRPHHPSHGLLKWSPMAHLPPVSRLCNPSSTLLPDDSFWSINQLISHPYTETITTLYILQNSF